MNEKLSFILGAAITILTTYVNNRFQFKRDKMKFENDQIIENKKNQFELDRLHRAELRSDLERLNNVVGRIEYSISLTSSVIDAEKKLSLLDFDSHYQKELEQIIELETLSATRFPEIYSSVLCLSGLHHQYWGYQRFLLLTDINTAKEAHKSSLMKITEICNNSKREISKMRTLSLEIAERTKNNYA